VIRDVVTAVLRIALGLFFRRIDVVGRERVPATGPTMFAINHPNGLIDPVLVLCQAPRPVAFLGKAPLLRLPVIGRVARALDTIPVHRRHDPGSDPAHNRETFARARALLEAGGTIAIAPEGVSHDEPGLKPLKTGAARIALGAGTEAPVAIVPVGLFYTEKATFRSAALVLFGSPVSVAAAPLDAGGEPPPDRVAAVTRALDDALRNLVIEADDHRAVEVIARAERLVAGSLPGGNRRPLDQVLEARQTLVAGYRRLASDDPALLARLVRRVDRLESAFRLAGMDPGAPRAGSTPSMIAALGALLVRLGLLLPLALPGLAIHYPAYRLVGVTADRLAKGHRDAVATIKVISAAVFYPLTWIALGIGVGTRWGVGPGLAVLLLGPVTGLAALKLVERFDRFVSRARALGFYLAAPERAERLIAERELLRSDLLRLAERLGVGATTGR